MGNTAPGRSRSSDRHRDRHSGRRRRAATKPALPIPLGHRVYVVPCRHYAVIKGCGYEPLSGRRVYLLLCDGSDPAWWAYEESVIDCGAADRRPRALLAPGGLA